MIIVSQDKKDIINFNNIKAISIKENKIIAIGQFIIAEEDGAYILGEYKTEERAKEVLQEITNTYDISKSSNNSLSIPALDITHHVYKMPEK